MYNISIIIEVIIALIKIRQHVQMWRAAASFFQCFCLLCKTHYCRKRYVRDKKRSCGIERVILDTFIICLNAKEDKAEEFLKKYK